jgi:hypothetical protein
LDFYIITDIELERLPTERLNFLIELPKKIMRMHNTTLGICIRRILILNLTIPKLSNDLYLLLKLVTALLRIACSISLEMN